MFPRSILVGVIFARIVLGANILFLATVQSPSHYIWHEVLVEGLLGQGHNVTLMGYGDPTIKSANYTVIKVKAAEDFFDEEAKAAWVLQERNVVSELQWMWLYTVDFARHDLDSDSFKRLLDYPKDFFDIAIFDATLSHHLYPLIDHFGNIPAIAATPFGIPPYIGDAFGHHFYPYYPNYALPYTNAMTFRQRLQNTLAFAVSYFFKSYYLTDLHRLTIEKFGEDTPSPTDYERRLALLLANYDPILDYPQPLPPQIIAVGGLNARPAKKLPDEIQKILDDAKNGAIFFSLGTNINSAWLSAETKKIFLDTFSKLKETVLWKYNGDDLGEIPKNVIIRKWFPQNDILAHKNVKLFISHTGMLSTHEAIYHGVPIVGVPFFMDQINNARKVESKVLGKKVDFRTLTGNVFYETVREVLQNPIYKTNALKLSRQFRDRPRTAQETAVFWIEYVLRHKDVGNLSTKGRDASFYSRENLDVLGFLFVSALVAVYFVTFALKVVVKKTILRGSVKVKQH